MASSSSAFPTTSPPRCRRRHRLGHYGMGNGGSEYAISIFGITICIDCVNDSINTCIKSQFVGRLSYTVNPHTNLAQDSFPSPLAFAPSAVSSKVFQEVENVPLQYCQLLNSYLSMRRTTIESYCRQSPESLAHYRMTSHTHPVLIYPLGLRAYVEESN